MTNNNALRPDAQAFDEIRLYTIPRYKTSGLSGDEWRISTKMEFYRKGELKHEAIYDKIGSAIGFLFYEYHNAISDGKGYFAGDGIHCDQEGCNELATIIYEKKFEYCNNGHKTECSDISKYRHFCELHKTRGNCGLDDADINYK